MTCIVGVAKDGKVYMGGDGAGSDGYNITIFSQPKVFMNGSFLIGYTSSFRMGQILEFGFNPPQTKRRAV